MFKRRKEQNMWKWEVCENLHKLGYNFKQFNSYESLLKKREESIESCMGNRSLSTRTKDF